MPVIVTDPNPKLKPFRYNTRRRFQRFGTQTFAGADTFLGQQQSYQIPQVGFLAAIICQVDGTVTRAGGDTGTFGGRLFNCVKRLRVSLNLGSASLVDASGYGIYQLNQTLKYNYGPDLGGDGSGPAYPPNGYLTMDPDVYSGKDAVPETAVPFLFTYFVPISINLGRNFNLGLVNLQAPEIRANVEVTMTNTLAELFETPIGNPPPVLTGTHFNDVRMRLSYLFFEVPNPDEVNYPPYVVHRLIEDRTPFANTGDVTYQIPRQGTLLRLLQNVICNNRNNAYDWRALTLRVNKTDDIERQSSLDNRFFSRFNYGHSMPAGMIVWEFYNAEEVPCSGDFRDAIDTESVSTIEFITSIDGGATLGNGNNYIDSLRQIVQVLQT